MYIDLILHQLKSLFACQNRQHIQTRILTKSSYLYLCVLENKNIIRYVIISQLCQNSQCCLYNHKNCSRILCLGLGCYRFRIYPAMSTDPSGGQDPLSPVSKTTQVTPKINPPFSDQLISTLIFVLIPLQSPHPLPRTTGQAIQPQCHTILR